MMGIWRVYPKLVLSSIWRRAYAHLDCHSLQHSRNPDSLSNKLQNLALHFICCREATSAVSFSVLPHPILTPPSNLMESGSSRMFSWQPVITTNCWMMPLKASVLGKIVLGSSYKLVITWQLLLLPSHCRMWK